MFWQVFTGNKMDNIPLGAPFPPPPLPALTYLPSLYPPPPFPYSVIDWKRSGGSCVVDRWYKLYLCQSLSKALRGRGWTIIYLKWLFSSKESRELYWESNWKCNSPLGPHVRLLSVSWLTKTTTTTKTGKLHLRRSVADLSPHPLGLSVTIPSLLCMSLGWAAF